MIFTIDSDDEVEPETISDDEEEAGASGPKDAARSSKGKPASAKQRDRKITEAGKKRKAAFEIEFDDGSFVGGRAEEDSDEEQGEDEDEEEDQDEAMDAADMDNVNDFDIEVDGNGVVRKMARSDERAQRALEKAKTKKAKGSSEEDEAAAQEAALAAYFDEAGQAQSGQDVTMFSQLNLSRPLLRAIENAGYVSPTPIQAKVIPLALAGRDVCASAVTGSGKTAAFVLPFLERLLYKPKDSGAIRVLVVTPTRELATQIYAVLQKLAQFTSVTCSLICGGKKDIKSQAAALRLRPDVVVGTPGRIIDHLRNSPSVNVDELDVLVLDEVDRLLDLGFQEEIEELVRHCPESRQTLLFSATMTTRVEDLVKLSLKRPVRVKTEGNSVTTVAPRLVQEFVRVRKEEEREAMLASLVVRVFSKRCIVFYEMKKDAHRFHAIISLMGVKSVELHGDLPQVQRDLALQKFRDSEADVLVATDVAARGLDIPGVRFVVNAEMPRSTSTYVHRVGRTARASASGVSVTLVGDARRKVMKELLKGEGGLLGGGGDQAGGEGKVLSRTIPPAVITKLTQQIQQLESQIEKAMSEERLRSRLDVAMREAERAQNLIEHEDEISARPARTWYQSETAKKKTTVAAKAAVESGAGSKAAAATTTAQEKALALARSDDYRREENTNKEHRLSRKKRRRLEALREDAGVSGGGTGAKEAVAKARESETRMLKAVSRKAKVNTLEQAAAFRDRDLGGSSGGGNKGKKVKSHVRAIGGLDQDSGLMDWDGGAQPGLSSKERKKAAREKEFTDFDPNMRLRKGGKVGRASFKSSKKFKRR